VIEIKPEVIQIGRPVFKRSLKEYPPTLNAMAIPGEAIGVRIDVADAISTTATRLRGLTCMDKAADVAIGTRIYHAAVFDINCVISEPNKKKISNIK
jgi:hypothetical protein